MFIEQLFIHQNILSDDLIDAMGGIVQKVLYSIESASPRLQKQTIKKQLNIENIYITNQKLFKKGITTSHNFIVGLPTETDEELRMNIELMIELKKINPFTRALIYLFLPLPMTPLHKTIENEMNLRLPHSLSDYEWANFEITSNNIKKELNFRPWLDEIRYKFLGDYLTVFNDVFRENNQKLTKESELLLQNNPKLKRIFTGIEKINHPKKFYRPYLLDRCLNEEKIDLHNDFKKYCF